MEAIILTLVCVALCEAIAIKYYIAENRHLKVVNKYKDDYYKKIASEPHGTE